METEDITIYDPLGELKKVAEEIEEEVERNAVQS